MAGVCNREGKRREDKTDSGDILYSLCDSLYSLLLSFHDRQYMPCVPTYNMRGLASALAKHMLAFASRAGVARASVARGGEGVPLGKVGNRLLALGIAAADLRSRRHHARGDGRRRGGMRVACM